MTTITRWTGFDSHGNPVVLGRTDTDGRPVGFIDAGGLAWESVLERDLAVTAGRYKDAMIGWKRNHNGEMVTRNDDGSFKAIVFPNPWAIAKDVCLDPAHVNDAADSAVEDYLFWARLRNEKRTAALVAVTYRFARG